MTIYEMLQHVDHTMIKPYASWDDIHVLCEEAIKYETATVCVPPCYVRKIHETYGYSVSICTVVGYPLGYSSTEAKILEVKQALADGADEIDLMINLTDVKDGYYNSVENEIRTIKEIIGNKVLKVIIETCYLSEQEKIKLCKIVTKAGADYIRTSTGFGEKGATMDDILLISEHIGPDVKIKAAGGIRTLDELEAYIAAGCDRIGNSTVVKLVRQMQKWKQV